MDQIELLLKSTGLSPDELIKKLSEYKTSATPSSSSLIEEENTNQEELVEEEIILIDEDEDSSQEKPETAQEKHTTKIKEIIDLSDEDLDEEKQTIMQESNRSNINEESNIHSKNKNTSLSPNKKTERLKITSLLEKRFQKSAESGDTDLQESEIVESEETLSQNNKRPLLGFVRKRINKKIRPTKPPWIQEESEEEESEEIQNVGTSEDTRQKIFNQLSMLRMRKKEKETPLVNIVNNIPGLYSKRLYRNEREVDKENDKFKIRNLGENPMIKEISPERIEEKNKDEEKKLGDGFEIINQNLDSPAIKVTKTDQFERIKGWKKKKLVVKKKFLAENEGEGEDDLMVNLPEKSIEATPGCSYAPSPKLKKNDGIFGSDVLDSFLEPNGIKSEKDEDLAEKAINVFASNNLDGFLNQQRNLKISYDVPNLESSEGDSIDFLDSKVIVQDPPTDVRYIDYKRSYTVAADEEDSCLNPINTKSFPNKPRTLAEKRRMLEKAAQKSAQTQMNGLKRKREGDNGIIRDIDSLPEDFVYSTINYQGKKLKIPSYTEKVTHVEFFDKNQRKHDYQDDKKEYKRPSIYGNIKTEGVRYKPGPLCKKVFLQNSSSAWSSVVKELPKVYLKVKPENGKPIHPRITEYVNFDTFEITPQRAEFALSALVGQNNKKAFEFEIPYEHNKQNVLLLKPNDIKTGFVDITKDKLLPETPQEVELSIKNVINGLIGCIENREIENSIIQEDDYKPEVEPSTVTKKGKKRSNKAEVIKGKCKKTNLELRRLNVKVIEVNIEEDVDPVECEKSYCKLGCICKSLNSMPIPNDHCGRVGCLFNCTCNFERSKRDTLKFILPAGTDILSDRTVSRLQHAVKKDLARVEKEFTQTVIHANNQTIVVGESTDRKRRPLKLPKKYKDYIESTILSDCEKSDEEEELKIKVVDNIPRKMQNLEKPKVNYENCKVFLKKLYLPHVIPLCLTHCLYNCHCNYQFNKLQTVKLKPISKLLAPVENKETVKTKYNNKKVKPPVVMNAKKVSPVVKKTLGRYKKSDECARTKGIVTNYYVERNKTPEFKRLINKRIRNDSYHQNFSEKSSDSTLVNENNYINIVEDSSSPLGNMEPMEDVKPNRRKQRLEFRQFDVSEPAVQPKRKKQMKMSNSPKNSPQKPSTELNINQKLSSHIYLPREAETQQFSKNIDKRNGSNTKFRLLPWSILIQKFEEKVVTIWFSKENGKFKYFLSNTDKSPSPGYKNINIFEEVANKSEIQPDFIRWIMLKCVPANKKEGTSIFAILKISKNIWEICGVCSRKETEVNGIEPQEKRIPQCEVAFSVGSFQLKCLYPYDQVTERKIIDPRFSIKVALPEADPKCKWRVLKVTSKFSVLSLEKNGFTIKCSEILSLIKTASKFDTTIIVNSEIVKKNYLNKLFGIYICPNYFNKIFIGPYEPSEDHGLDTLRYVNNILVKSEYFNKMIGKSSDETVGTWYQSDPSFIEEDTVIDLTETEETDKSKTFLVTKTSPRSVLKSSIVNCEKSAVRNELGIESAVILLGTKLKEVNNLETSYISHIKTIMLKNKLWIPNLCVPVCFMVNFDNGLIYGFQHTKRSEVGVYWPRDVVPFNRRFKNMETASEWLQMELNSFFIRVPSDFKIEVSVVTPKYYKDALTRETLPLKYFEDAYVVGKFGAVNLTECATDFLMNQMDEDEDIIVPNNLDECMSSKLGFSDLQDYYDGGEDELLNFLQRIDTIIRMEIMKSEKLLEIKRSLVTKKVSLLTKHTLAINGVSENSRNSVGQELTQAWTRLGEQSSIKSVEPPSPTEIICLDSDEEVTPEDSSSSKSDLIESLPSSPKNPVNQNLNTSDDIINPGEFQTVFCKFNSNDCIKIGGTSKVRIQNSKIININCNNDKKKLHPCIPVNGKLQIVQKPPNFVLNTKAEIIPITKATLKHITGKSLLKPCKMAEIRPITNLVNNTKNIEKIDISHLSSDTVSSILGTSLKNIVSLSSAQLQGLKALSELKPT